MTSARAHAEHGKRVLVIVQNLPLALDRRVTLECRALRSAGYGVSVVCPRAPGERRYRVSEDGVIVRSYRPPPEARGPLGFAVEFVYCWLRTAWLSVAALLREGFDAVQACNPPDTYWALALPYKVLGKSFVYDQHDLCPEVYRSRFLREKGLLLTLLRALERRAYKTADRVISTNGSYRAIAVERGGVAPERISIVRSGPDHDRMRRGESHPELRHGRPHLCCYLGVMGPQDGVDGLLRSIDVYVNGLGRKDTSFALLGFGDCLQDLRRQVQELGLQDWVEMPGRADAEMIDRYLSTADVGLSPDPFSPLNDVSTMNKTLEYMAYELPVLAYDLHETRVSAGPAAVYVARDDEGGYAAALAHLLDDAERRREMGRIGRWRIERRLAWCYSEPVYVGAYDELLGVKRPVVTDVRTPAECAADVVRTEVVVPKQKHAPEAPTVPTEEGA